MLVVPTCKEFIGFPLKLDKTPDYYITKRTKEDDKTITQASVICVTCLSNQAS